MTNRFEAITKDKGARVRQAAMPAERLRIAVVGGAGHVGAPLSLLLAERGFHVTLIDRDQTRLGQLERGEFPFLEEGGEELLRAVLTLTPDRRPRFSHAIGDVGPCDVIIVTIGTPVDAHLNPDLQSLDGVMEAITPFLRDGHVLLLRSTVFPGTSEKIHAALRSAGRHVSVSFCPERIAQGHALEELQTFPQLISGSDARALAVARTVCSAFAPALIELNMTEAELAKLFTNAWRYMTFAIANQFYMLAQERGLDFFRIRQAMMEDYPRTTGFPSSGFAAGPCLFKDTMQLAAYNRQHFALGHAAMLVNETLPEFLIEQAKRRWSFAGLRVGILGMAFKIDSDDHRESLAYKLRRLLRQEQALVMCTDPYIRDPSFFALGEVLASSELLFIGCPHTLYQSIAFEGREVIDCWGFLKPQRKPPPCALRETPRAATAAAPV